MMSSEVLEVARNALFPAGRAFVSQQVRFAVLSRLVRVDALKQIFDPKEVNGRIVDLLPKGAKKWAQFERLRDGWARHDRIAIDKFLDDANLESPAEEGFVRDVFVPLFGETGLAQLKSQVPFRRGSGRKGRIDFGLNTPCGPVAIEIDGRTYHSESSVSEEEFADGLRRQNELVAQGWVVHRIAAGDIRTDPGGVGVRLSDFLATMDWPVGAVDSEDEEDPESAVISRAEHFLISDWCPRVSRTQLALFQKDVLGVLDQDRPVRVFLASGACGAAAVAFFDLVEALENAAALFGKVLNVPELSVTVCENDDDAAAMSSELMNAFWDRAPGATWTGELVSTRTTVKWRCVVAAPANDALIRPAHDLGVFFLGDQAVENAEAVRQIAEGLSDTGKLVIVEFTRSPPEPDNDGTTEVNGPIHYPENPQEATVNYFLRRFFGHESLRDGQWGILRKALRGASVLGVLPTGAGKSVCYQLPSILLPGCGLVISPLISLIEDQKQNLRASGLDFAGGVNSAMTPEDAEAEVERFFAGSYKLFYVSPERLQNRGFMERLRGGLDTGTIRINCFVVDEAHLASEWGHEFRPSYLALPMAREKLAPKAALVLTTATASQMLRGDVLRMFGLDEAEDLVRPDEFDRPEISFAVYEVRSDEEKCESLLKMLRDQVPSILGARDFEQLHRAARRPGRCTSGGLVFTPWAKEKSSDPATTSIRAKALAKWLQKKTIEADYYTGSDLENERFHDAHKTDVQRRFKRDLLPVVVATKGFGTGIDKPNVRYVIHTSYSGSLEGYYQEAGRCGRDRQDSHAAIMWIRRHAECREFPPRCVLENTRGRCSFGLETSCSFARQASFYRLNYPGVDVDFDQQIEIMKEPSTLREAIKAGGNVQFDARFQYSPLVDKEGTCKNLVRPLLKALVKIGIVAGWNENAREGYFFVSPSRLDRATLVDRLQHRLGREGGNDFSDMDTPEIVERGLRLVAGLTSANSRNGKLLFLHYLQSKWRAKEGKARIPIRPKSWEQSNVDTERLLYRLQLLGVVGDYYRTPGKGMKEWTAEVLPYEKTRVEDSFRYALGRLARPTKVIDRIVADWGTTVEGKHGFEAAGMALKGYLESYYEVMERQRQQMLENMERFAATTECRRAMLLRYLNERGVDEFPDGCNRCDNCSIEPLEVTLARANEVTDQETARLAEGKIQQGFESELNPTEFLVTVDWFMQEGRVKTLRDRCLRLLEDRPENSFGLFAGGHALAQLDDGDAALELFDRLLSDPFEREDGTGCESILRHIPPPLSGRLIGRYRDTLTRMLDETALAQLQFDVAVASRRPSEAQSVLLRALSRNTEKSRKLIVQRGHDDGDSDQQ